MKVVKKMIRGTHQIVKTNNKVRLLFYAVSATRAI